MGLLSLRVIVSAKLQHPKRKFRQKSNLALGALTLFLCAITALKQNQNDRINELAGLPSLRCGIPEEKFDKKAT